MIELKDLVEYCISESISSRFYPTEESEYRRYCREYSKFFNTPLIEVYNLSPEHIILNVYEEYIKRYDLEKYKDYTDLIEQLRRIEDPNYDAAQEKDLTDFIKKIEKAEKQRLEEGRTIPSLGNPKPKVEEKKLPEEGYLNLSYLENSQDEK